MVSGGDLGPKIRIVVKRDENNMLHIYIDFENIHLKLKINLT